MQLCIAIKLLPKKYHFLKTLKILPKALALLRDILLENEFQLERLQRALGKFVETLEMYKRSNLIKNDTETQLINEVTDGTDGFLLVLELSNLLWKKGKTDM